MKQRLEAAGIDFRDDFHALPSSAALEIFRKSAEESRQLNIFRKVSAAINIQERAGE